MPLQRKVASWRNRWRRSFAIFLHKLDSLRRLEREMRIRRVCELAEEPETLSLQVPAPLARCTRQAAAEPGHSHGPGGHLVAGTDEPGACEQKVASQVVARRG